MAVKASCSVTLSCYRDTQSVTRYYKLQSSTSSAPSKPSTNPPSEWDDAEPSYTSGSTNTLYFCDLTVFSDGTWSYSTVSRSSSYEAAKEAYNKAQNAQNSVDNMEVGGRNYIRFGKGNVKAGLFENFDTVTDGYGEHTLTSKKTYSNVDITNGFVLNCRDYEVGKEVVFSYDIMFTEWSFPSGANRAEWWFGQRYTNQAISGGDTTGQWTRVTAHTLPEVGVNGCELNKWMHVEKHIIIPAQAAEGVGTNANIQIYNSNADVEASVTFRIKNVKLEYGNKATDWSPAPEDVDENLSGAIDSVNESIEETNNRISDTESLIAKLEDVIAMLVTDGNGTSLMTQTTDGWTFNIDSLQKSVSDTSNSLNDIVNEVGDINGVINVLQNAVKDFGELSEYVKIMVYEDEPCIKLGENDSDFKLLITNTRIMFMEGSNTPTYINTKGLVTKNIEVEDELMQGGFVWRIHGNGNLGLIWKGADS